MKYIGLDLGRATTDAVAVNGRGQESVRRRIETREVVLVELIESIPGPKRVVLEECQMADWVTRVLRPHVDEIIRCQPQHNRLISRAENQDDYLDALHLAQLLYRELREAVRAYWRSSWDVTRSKNHLKAFLLFHGIAYENEQPYTRRHRERFREAKTEGQA